MKRSLLIACLIGTGMLIPSSAGAQSGSEDFRIERWSGGLIESDIRMALALAGPGVSSMGGAWNVRSGFGPENLFTNPAMLGVGSGGLMMTARPPAANGWLGVGDNLLVSSRQTRESTDRFLEDLGYSSSDEPGYTRVLGVRAGQPAQIGALAGSFQVAPGFTAALGYYRPLSMHLGFRASGMEAVLDAGRRSGTQTIDIDVLAQGSASAVASAQLDVFSFGVGTHLATDDLGSWHAGASVSRYMMAADLDWSVRPELLILLSGSQPYYFNDPTDPNLAPGETNDLFWDARANYRGGAWGARAGLRFAAAGDWLGLSVSGKVAEPLTMKDPNAFARSFLPGFVNLAGELDPDPFQDDLLDVERLNLAKPNLTTATSDSLGGSMTFRQPGTLTFGLDLGLGPHTLSANYVRYSGQVSLQGVYGERGGQAKEFRVGKQMEHGLRLGLDFRFPERVVGAGWLLLPLRLLFLDVDGLIMQAMSDVTGYSNPHFGVGGGMVWGRAVVEGVERNIREPLQEALGRTLPSRLVMYRQYTVFEKLDVGVTVAGVPDLLLRTSLNYRFGD